MKTYYYVYKHGDTGPRVRHSDLPTAQNEAERLAAKEPGRIFEILQCLGYASTSKASTVWLDGEGPPETPGLPPRTVGYCTYGNGQTAFAVAPERPLYIMLEDGDTFQKGDEFVFGADWRPRTSGFGEIFCRSIHAAHRRPI